MHPNDHNSSSSSSLWWREFAGFVVNSSLCLNFRLQTKCTQKRVGKSQHRALSLSLWIMWKDVSKLIFKSLNLRSSFFFCCCSTGLRIRLFNFSLKILTCALYILRVSLEDLKEKNGSPWWEWDSTSPYSITVLIPLVHSNFFFIKKQKMEDK